MSLDKLKKLIKEGIEDFVSQQQIETISFEDNPLEYILQKYPSLDTAMTDLMTDKYRDYITGIYVIAPKPTTFRILLHNGQEFYLIYGPQAYIAKISSKKYNLANLNEEQFAIKAIANLLELGMPPGSEGPGEQTDNEPKDKEETPPEETPTKEPAPEEELKEIEEVKPKKVLRFKIIKEGIEKKSFKLNEGSEEDIYDNVIRKTLNLKEEESIPTPKGKYSLKDGTFMEQVSPDDKAIFDKLYNVAPPKKGEEEGETKGVGNGEVALYWLYQHSGVETQIGRSGDDPDLFIAGKGVEVKAYKSHTGKIGLGRFGADKENLQLLSVIFGIKALSEALGAKKETTTINPTNFKGTDLMPAFEQIIELEKIPDLEGLAAQYSIFANIKQNIDILNQNLSSPKNALEGAQAMAYKMIESKLSRKPGNGGYLVNVLKNGSIKFFKIDLEKVKSNENLLDNFAAKQSAIYLDFGKIFG
jgi:hypothetical protein